MPYASRDDLISAAGDYERFRQLVENRSAPPEVEDAEAYWITQAQRAGDALVNRHLQPRHRVPLSNHDDSVVYIAAQEGIYYLASTRGMATEAEHDAHTERITVLEAMRDGKQSPGDPLPDATTSKRPRLIERTDAWSRYGLKGFCG